MPLWVNVSAARVILRLDEAPGRKCAMPSVLRNQWAELMSVEVAAVVVAAGRGTRAGSDLPKQYRALGADPMIRASLRRIGQLIRTAEEAGS